MKRIKNLIDQVASSNQKPKEEEIPAQNLVRSTPNVTEFFNNPLGDREVVESIDQVYYGTEEDTGVFELKKLPSNPSQQLVSEMRESLQIQLCAVTKKLSGVILQNQPAYQKELQRVRELQEVLRDAFNTCHAGKDQLLSATATMSPRLLVSVQHRKNLASLRLSLETIKTLEHTDVRLRELLVDEQYPEAIQLCLECQKAVAIFKQYSCIKDLSSKLQDTIELIEEQIDVALSKTCDHFEKDMYEKLQTSYKLLGKPQTAIDQLLMHFTTCIHNTGFQVVLGFAKLCSTESQTNLHKFQFGSLCSSIDPSVYIPCLLALCKALWNIMNCYHKTTKWHDEEFQRIHDSQTGGVEFDSRYIQQKLEHGRHRVWLDVQSRVRAFLLGTDLSSFKYDDFIKVLDIVNKLVSVGKAFCGNDHDSVKGEEGETVHEAILQNLQEPIYRQSLRYFRAYHKKCMDELCMFLENEAWEACPIKTNFSLLQLPEFDFLHEATYNNIIKSPFGGNSSDAQESVGYFSDAKGHPFSEFERKTSSNGGQATSFRSVAHDDMSDDEEVSPELLQDYVDEDQDSTEYSRMPAVPSQIGKGPILTNAALNILRICGKYLKMCDVLKPIAMDVIMCMSYLFDYYLFSVYSFFVEKDSGVRRCSEKLASALKRIESELIFHEEPTESWSNGTGGADNARVQLASLSPIVNLSDSRNLFGFLHRVIATESLANLAKQYGKIQPYLEKLMPSSKQAFLHQFYSQTITTFPEVRSQVFYAVASKSIDYSSILVGMSQVKWDIRDIMSQHSRYIDDLVHQFKLLKIKCGSAAEGLPSEISEVVWKHCIMMSNHTLVEGYSSVKKCSNEGRALMQLDFQQFLLKVDEVTAVRPIPGKSFVENYIKAFYLAEEDLELWMKDHPEYSEKQLSALINSSATSTVGTATKKNKQRMLALIDDLKRR